MVRSPNPVQVARERWRNQPCPYCGARGVADWICLLSTYGLHCHACGQVVEAFELYQDTDGHYLIENHERAEPDDVERGKPIMRRIQ